MPNTITTASKPPLTFKDLPLVAYRLGCGHEGSERAIMAGDTLFCPACAQLRKVTSINP